MSDLISRSDVIKAIENLQDCYNGFSDTYDKACIIGVIEEVPSVNDFTDAEQRILEGAEYTIGFDQSVKEKLFEEFVQSISKVPVLEHKCNNCGGTIEMDAEQHIFKCPYCGSVYAIGTKQVNG